MRLLRYIEKLNEIAHKYPQAEVVYMTYMRENEGNGFDFVKYLPYQGNYDGVDFIPDDGTEGFKVNAVCLN